MAQIITHRDLFAPAFYRAWSDIYNKRVGTVSCAGGRGCVDGDTELLTPNGTVKVRDFKGGEIYSLSDNGVVTAFACRALRYTRETLYRVALSNGSSVVCTDEHRLLTPSGWKMAKELAAGDEVGVTFLPGFPGFAKDASTSPRDALPPPELYDAGLPSGSSADALHSTRRLLGWIYHYWNDCRLCDGLPPKEGETYLDVLRRLADDSDDGKVRSIARRFIAADGLATELRQQRVGDEAYSDNLRAQTFVPVKSIEAEDQDFYYDLFVPFYNNYITEGGIVNHNSTKSTSVSTFILLRMEMARRKALAAKASGDRKWKRFLTHAACFRKVGGTLADSCFTQFSVSAGRLGLADKYYMKKTPLTIIRRGTGQRIYFRGLDDPQKARSITPPFSYISDLWFEELSEYDGIEEIQDVTRSIQRGGHEFMTFYSYNPPETSSNWVNYALAELEREDPTFRQYKSDFRTVPREWLGEKFFRDAEILRRLNERAYRHVYLGEITGNGGTVFPNVEAVSLTDEEIAKFDNVLWGADFGLRDPTVLLGGQYDSSTNILTLFDEVYKPDMTLDEIEHDFKEHHHGYEYIQGDSAAAQIIVSLRSRGVQILPVEKYGDFRMMTTKWLQSLVKLRIDPKRCPNTYREFVNCEYEKNKAGEFTGRIPDGNDHSIDSCRYMCAKIARYTVPYS